MTHPADVARAIAGAQSQEARAGRLALRARSPRLTAARVEKARLEERSLLRAWAMRGTVHLLNAEDAQWTLPLYEPLMAADSRRRLGQLGMPARTVDRALGLVDEALRADGQLSRTELTERLRPKRVRLDASTRLHLFRLAVAERIACLGADIGGNSSLVPFEGWLAPRPRHDRDAALRDLARRYLAAFGPATEGDFAKWAGLPMRDIRTGLEGIAGELSDVRIARERAFTLRGATRRSPGGIVRLLPPWDTYLMGYRDRTFLAGENWPRIMTGGGILLGTIVVDGVAAGTWGYRVRGPELSFELAPFAPLDDEVAAGVEAELKDVRRFEGHRL